MAGLPPQPNSAGANSGDDAALGSLDTVSVAVADMDLRPSAIWARESVRFATLLSPPDL